MPSDPYEELNNRLASYETRLSEAELAEEEDQIAAALLATEPVDMPRPDPIYALMSRFTEDLFLLSAKLKKFGRVE